MQFRSALVLALAFTLILALCVSLIQASIPLYGAHKNQYNLMRLAAPCSGLTFLFLSIALISLTTSFLQHDFSVYFRERKKAPGHGIILEQKSKGRKLWLVVEDHDSR